MQIAFNDTAELPLLHPVTGEPLLNSKEKPMIAVIRSTRTKEYKDAAAAVRRSAAKKGKKKLSDAETEKYNTDLILSCVVEFKNLEELNPGDGPLGSGAKNVRQVLENADLDWLREQVNEATGDLENFIKAPNED